MRPMGAISPRPAGHPAGEPVVRQMGAISPKPAGHLARQQPMFPFPASGVSAVVPLQPPPPAQSQSLLTAYLGVKPELLGYTAPLRMAQPGLDGGCGMRAVPLRMAQPGRPASTDGGGGGGMRAVNGGPPPAAPAAGDGGTRLLGKRRAEGETHSPGAVWPSNQPAIGASRAPAAATAAAARPGLLRGAALLATTAAPATVAASAPAPSPTAAARTVGVVAPAPAPA